MILADLLAEYNCIESGENSHIQRFFKTYFSDCFHFPDDTPELMPSAVAELIKVSVLGRNSDLSAFDFSGLDLCGTRLNGIKLSRGENNGPEHTAKFEGAVLAKDTLNAAGNAGAVQMMLYIEPYLLTLSKRGFFAFNMKEKVQYFVTEYYEDAIEAAVIDEEKKKIITGDRGNRLVRACSVSPRVRMAQSDFLPDEAKTAGNTLCINEDFGKIWRKRCKPDVRGEILNRL